MSDLPIRSKSHKIDSKGLSILQYKLEDHFIFRNISERYYGIDAFIELTGSENPLGTFATVQVKSKEKIKWNKKDKFNMKIRTETINYWMLSNNPVIIFLVDCSKKEVYFVDVKKQARKKYKDLDEGGISFTFEKENKIGTEVGLIRLLYIIFSENSYPNFLSSVNDFSANYDRYKEHCKANIRRDEFLIVDEDVLVINEHIHIALIQLDNFLHVGLEKIDFEGIREKAIDIYNATHDDEFYEVIEWENSQINCILLDGIKKIKKKLVKVVLEKEKHYWKEKHHSIYRKVQMLE